MVPHDGEVVRGEELDRRLDVPFLSIGRSNDGRRLAGRSIVTLRHDHGNGQETLLVGYAQTCVGGEGRRENVNRSDA